MVPSLVQAPTATPHQVPQQVPTATPQATPHMVPSLVQAPQQTGTGNVPQAVQQQHVEVYTALHANMKPLEHAFAEHDPDFHLVVVGFREPSLK
jgi:hypothetical protein